MNLNKINFKISILSFLKTWFFPHRYFLAVFVVIVAFFFKALTNQSIITLGDFTGSDLLDLIYPFQYVLRESLHSGQLPLWTPHLAFGFPLLAEGQIAAFYPINLFFAFFFPASMAVNYEIVINFVLAAVFMYLYMRTLKVTSFAASTASLVYVFSGFFVARAKFPHHLVPAMLLPLAFLLIHRFFRTGSFIYFIFLGIILGFVLLGSHPQLAFYGMLGILYYLVGEFILSTKEEKKRSLAPFIIGTIVMLGIGFGLAAVQLLPTYEFSQLTRRVSLSYPEASQYSFHPKNLLGFFSPYFLGNPAHGTYTQLPTDVGIWWENASYVGVLPLLFAFWAVARVIRKRKKQPESPHFYFRGYILFFFITAIIGIVLAMGKYAPLFQGVWTYVPGIQLFRFPTRFLLFTDLSLAVLSGFGAMFVLDYLQKRKSKSSSSRFEWPLTLSRTKILIFAIIVLDLWVFASDQIGFTPLSSFLKKPESVQFLQSQNSSDPYRIYSVSQYIEGSSPYLVQGWIDDSDALVKIREAVPPNTNLLYDISSLSDRSWFEGGLAVERREKLERLILDSVMQDSFLLGKVLGMYNVKYVLAFSSNVGGDFKKVKDVNLGKSFAAPLTILENSQVLPRFMYVPEAIVETDEEKLIKTLLSEEFYPPKQVILEEQPHVGLASFQGSLEDFRKRNAITVSKNTPTEIDLTLDASRQGFVVFSDLYYPGWEVYVDGKKDKIWRANYLVRAVEIQNLGPHRVQFVYRPQSFKYGSWIFLGALGFVTITLSGWMLLRVVRRFRHR